MTWFAGTKRNVGFLSMNRVISHGQAMRSTRAFSRVTHFIGDLPLLLRLDAVGLLERGLQALSELRRVVVGPEVHVEEPRRVHEPMVVDRGDDDAVLLERLVDGVRRTGCEGEARRDPWQSVG